MIVVLTAGDYSDYGIENIIDVDVKSQEEFDALIKDWKEKNPVPATYRDVERALLDSKPGRAEAYRRVYEARTAWIAQLREYLTSSGVGREVGWAELHEEGL